MVEQREIAAKVTKVLGYRRYKIAAQFGVTSRWGIRLILTGDRSRNLDCYEALMNAYNEAVQFKVKIREQMGIDTQ
jgi:hypothetical protein